MGTPDEADLKAQLWRRAYEIFDDGLETPSEQRHDFARARASGDPELLEIVFELLQNAREEDLDGVEEQEPRIGSKLGRYQITAKLGRGGMGQVYAAHDSELGRLVALKLLSGQTGSPGKMGSAERLIREAKAASALNHPNIVTVYDVVRHGSEVALAMELVEGQSMREVCGQPQPVGQVIHWARQIVQALAATHARGIVHRDIKPENVMLRPDGYVKVLDFGLARRTRLLEGAPSASASLFGFLGGTLSYMSPEQARGENPTQASDIFSLGSMLYELLCGVHPFQSASPIDTAYAIAHHEPKRAGSVRPEISAALSSLVAAMMAKDAADRPAAVELEQLLKLSGTPEPFTRRRRAPAMAALSIALLLVAAGAVFLRQPLETPKPLVLDPLTRLLDKNVTAAALSPDGTQLVYALFGGPLYLRRMSDGGTRILHSPAGLRASRLAWFADGKQLLISGAGDDRKLALWVLPLDSLERDAVLVPHQGRDAAPSPDGSRIALCSSDGSAIRIVDRDGSHPRVIRSAEPGANFHSLVWSPDSKRISYMILTQVARPPAKYSFVFETVDAESGLLIARIDDLPLFSATALPDGRIIGLPWAYPATSHGGELIEIRTNPSTGAVIGQSRTPMPYSKDGMFSSLTVSNNGGTMALISASEFVNIYAAEFAAAPVPALSNVRRLTFGLTQDYPQSWTPDSKAILFESNRNGRFELFRYELSSGRETMFYRGREDAVQPRVTPDGRWILFRQGASRFAAQLMRLPVDGSAQAAPVPMAGETGAEQGCGAAPASRCVVRSVEADQFVVRELDPVQGKGRVLARTPYGPYLIFDWSLSPDGSVIASPNHDSQSALIRLTPLDARIDERFIKLEGFRNLSSVSWSADGKGLFVTANAGSGGIMIYSDLEGHASQLLESSKVTFVVPSPDGQRIAYPEQVTSSTVQLLRRP
uniref:Serine/threonine protein kinase with WD40 repeats n=1 Tax=Solibacter usitatus (strain Ellin6076) TaxID=234267 RepID=Q01QY7_SOLUE